MTARAFEMMNASFRRDRVIIRKAERVISMRWACFFEGIPRPFDTTGRSFQSTARPFDCDRPLLPRRPNIHRAQAARLRAGRDSPRSRLSSVMSDSSDGKWTRRRFLEAIGMAGGAAAVYETMTALGLINVPEVFARQPLPPNSGTGKSVVILGAGIAGLTAAYELKNAQI